MKMHTLIVLLLFLSPLSSAPCDTLLPFTPAELPAQKLGRYNVDITKTSVSGLSSGAYMADQFLVAYSKTVIGAGLFSGGPYGCSEGNLQHALSRCMEEPLSNVAFDALLQKLHNKAMQYEEQGEIDSLEYLRTRKVYIYSGQNDRVVHPQITASIKDWYTLVGVPAENIQYDVNNYSSHALPTMDYGHGCPPLDPISEDPVSRTPWIADCDIDGARNVLTHILGELNPKEARSELSGKFIKFHQNDFFEDGNLTANELRDSYSMNEFGFAYVPRSCQEGSLCKIHVAFHGCRQIYNRNPVATPFMPNDATNPFGLQFVKYAGYNEWADTNNLIILYPQAQKKAFDNPLGCWNWFGYLPDTVNGYATKIGLQMRAVYSMVKRLSKDTVEGCQQWTSTNEDHAKMLRAKSDWCFLFNFLPYSCYRTIGSKEELGSENSITTLKQPRSEIDYYQLGECL